MTDDRFLLADFIGRRNWPTLSFVWRPLKASVILYLREQQALRVGVYSGGVSELRTFILSTQNIKTQRNFTGFASKTWNVCCI